MTEPIAVYELEIPLVDNRPPLHANQRLNWRQERRLKILVREAVEWRCKEARIGAWQHITVGAHYLPGDNRKRDASNLMPTQKVSLDACVRAGVVPDDSATWVTERMPVIEQGDGPRRLWLRVEIDR
jgi:crossover junction endodeoxyribonuclease RusA